MRGKSYQSMVSLVMLTSSTQGSCLFQARKAHFSQERLISAEKASFQPRKVESEEKEADFC
jgi:hypothetical protein